MPLTNKNKPKLIDCTLRDGGYYTDWDFSHDLISKYLRAMHDVSVDYVELGFRSFADVGFKGGCAYTRDEFIRHLDIPSDLKIGVMVNAGELLDHPDGINSALSALFVYENKSPVTLVRVAFHPAEIDGSLKICAWLKERGYTVGLNIMQIASCTAEEIKDIASQASSLPIDVLYFADSLGQMTQDDVSIIVDNLRKGWKGEIGIHAHDNMGMALANTLQAINDDVLWVDSTITGMGRGPGNTKTELLILELENYRKQPVNFASLLSVIEEYFKPLQSKFEWGTNFYYYLAGKYGIHPTYVQEMIKDPKYQQEDILTIIDYLRENGGKKFRLDALESGRYFYDSQSVGSWIPSALMAAQDVLIIGPGPGAVAHKKAIEDYIRAKKPVVLALNTVSVIEESLVSARVVCHPIRLLADHHQLSGLSQPLITPSSVLPEYVRNKFSGKELYDFGISITPNTFVFNESNCIVPTTLVAIYAFAVATSGKANRILLAGFDGYSSDDSRRKEMDEYLEIFQEQPNVPELIAITPSLYRLHQASVYAL